MPEQPAFCLTESATGQQAGLPGARSAGAQQVGGAVAVQVTGQHLAGDLVALAAVGAGGQEAQHRAAPVAAIWGGVQRGADDHQGRMRLNGATGRVALSGVGASSGRAPDAGAVAGGVYSLETSDPNRYT